MEGTSESCIVSRCSFLVLKKNFFRYCSRKPRNATRAVFSHGLSRVLRLLEFISLRNPWEEPASCVEISTGAALSQPVIYTLSIHASILPDILDLALIICISHHTLYVMINPTHISR